MAEYTEGFCNEARQRVDHAWTSIQDCDHAVQASLQLMESIGDRALANEMRRQWESYLRPPLPFDQPLSSDYALGEAFFEVVRALQVMCSLLKAPVRDRSACEPAFGILRQKVASTEPYVMRLAHTARKQLDDPEVALAGTRAQRLFRDLHS